MQKLDNHGRYTLYGVFLECKDDIEYGLKILPKGARKSKMINYRTFALVIHLYLKKAFSMLVNGYSVPLLNKFGILNVVKTKCIRYNPMKTSFFKGKDGKITSKREIFKKKSGYWYFVFWDAPKSLRHYRFDINIKYKWEYMKKVDEGFDYLDYTLDKYGRNASIDYIQHIK